MCFQFSGSIMYIVGTVFSNIRNKENTAHNFKEIVVIW
jgi:hypothetical protein